MNLGVFGFRFGGDPRSPGAFFSLSASNLVSPYQLFFGNWKHWVLVLGSTIWGSVICPGSTFNFGQDTTDHRSDFCFPATRSSTRSTPLCSFFRVQYGCQKTIRCSEGTFVTCFLGSGAAWDGFVSGKGTPNREGQADFAGNQRGRRVWGLNINCLLSSASPLGHLRFHPS